ncbi:hypothetical protein HUK65_14880 [Rhodobacteraceae bacterium 2376]|uniref:Uncharacterized protein n=1 Tax=Rhabdonatronobacter sediminivivens TaxID=2743469 RepID=A0A7Z0KZ30_9RHOB|nr:hypothetical protein [Rhabdonatronobacter sediminivivens]NYS26272.1 hypothetical protein [Rhabdonatronobacter sediminivivens]
MDREQISLSEEVIARILQVLLSRGIQGGDMKFATLELPSDRLRFFAACFKWLVAEGIVRAERVTVDPIGREPGIDDLYIYNPSLTAYGFQLMGQVVSIGASEDRLGAALVKSDPSNGFWRAGELVGGFLGGFTKSVGS